MTTFQKSHPKLPCSNFFVLSTVLNIFFSTEKSQRLPRRSVRELSPLMILCGYWFEHVKESPSSRNVLHTNPRPISWSSIVDIAKTEFASLHSPPECTCKFTVKPFFRPDHTPREKNKEKKSEWCFCSHEFCGSDSISFSHYKNAHQLFATTKQ